ncbi:MAG: polyprenyl synthetase family protein [Pseudomonadota bacterium]
MEFSSTRLSAYVARVEHGLEQLLPAAGTRPARLHTAMRYSLQAGGKRLRPVLVLAAAELFPPTGSTGSPPASPKAPPDPLPAAVAIECVHTYSLIHDDLPCMDNDDLRRGRPTAHKAFDEATALLAGDALLTQAFLLLALNYEPATSRSLVGELAAAAGSEHLIGGQMEDLLAEKNAGTTAAELDFIHHNKTAAMIQAALVMGGLIGRAEPAALQSLRQAGRHLGLAFQIIDDILDATADTAVLGKTAGKDAKAGKATFVKIHGLEAAQRMADEESNAAILEFRKLPGGAPFLVGLTEEMAARKR